MGFILNGKTAQELGLIMRTGEANPILPETRDRTVVVPGRPGAYDMGADFGIREINIPCAFVYANNQEELETYIRGLANHLLDPQGKPRELSLTFDAEPGKTYYVRYAGSLPIRRIIFDGQFTLSLVAFDPHAYGESKEESKDLTTSPEAIQLEAEGNTQIPPVITIENIGAETIESFSLKHEIIEEE